ncbi:DUF4419 domain-containing protein [Kitasatospora sp. NPDC004615]|uniref:DUF4419 domain-containing protein n=1 Tax=Kitasatospora sp. NPDC004615 TaxID=3364017 RepID=UPI0036846CCE
MTGRPRMFAYVGPPELLARADRSTLGRAIPALAELDRWLAELAPAERDEPVTYVVDSTGMLRLAPRRSEHVACAGGADVLAAGEIRFARQAGGGWAVREISNLSTGYCPDLDSWSAAADALDRAGLTARPDGFTHACAFRRCRACGQINLVKDDDLTCAVCDTALPAEWNLAAPRPAAAVIDLPLPPDDWAVELATTLRAVDNAPFLQAVSSREVHVHHRSATTLVAAPRPHGGPEPTWSLLVRAAHQSFCAHLPLSLAPDVLWYAVVHEVAIHVRLNSETYAGIFTDTPAHQQEIAVQDDSLLAPDPDWSRSIRLVLEPLREKLGAEVTDLFLPRFSTTTPDDLSSALVALMSVVGPYYRFTWTTLCGIPRIRLEGTAEDWQLLAGRVDSLAARFDGLRPWFDALRPVLAEIARTAAGGPVDEDFWRSFYKWKSHSGGESVTGWITALFAHTQTPDGPQPKTSFDWQGGRSYQQKDFPSHVSSAPFRWQRPDGEREMTFLAGLLGLERDGEYLRPRLAHAVLELLPDWPHPADHLLPDGWTHARLREVTGDPVARALPLDRTVTDDDPTRTGAFEPSHIVQVGSDYFVRSASDGRWHLGESLPDTGEIEVYDRFGPDLDEALGYRD